MPHKITNIRFKKYLFLSAFFMSGCVNSDPSQISLDQDYCSLVKETIGLDKLQQYYHVDTFPKRSPLTVVVGNKDVECKNLEKFGKPVSILYKGDASSQGVGEYLELTNVDVTNASALVNFSYDPEGIKGEITFKKVDSKWVVVDSILVER